MSINRPKLDRNIEPGIFINYYWEKNELVNFCQQYGLSAVGGKIEIEQAILDFLTKGIIKKNSNIKNLLTRDSDMPITIDTPVINYKNDAITRNFFIEHIGSKFKFNGYLRQFTKQENIPTGLTYGDLVSGWLEFETNNKSMKIKKPIAKQFKFNQFQRDFYAAETGKSREDCLAAWKFIRDMPGPATYAHYLEISQDNK